MISEITGVTGLAIVDAIIGGQRDPAGLAKLRDHRIHARAEIAGGQLETRASVHVEAVAANLPAISGIDHGMRRRDREAGGRL